MNGWRLTKYEESVMMEKNMERMLLIINILQEFLLSSENFKTSKKLLLSFTHEGTCYILSRTLRGATTHKL